MASVLAAGLSATAISIRAETAVEPATPTPAPAKAAQTPMVPPSPDSAVFEQTAESERVGAAQADIRYIAATPARLYRGLPWDYCGPRPLRLGPYQQPPLPGPLTPIDVDAGGLIHHQNTQVTELVGGVHLRRGSQEIDTEALSLEHETGIVRSPGKTFLAYPGLRLLGEKVQVSLDNDQGQISHASYRLMGPANMRGQAERIDVASPELIHVKNVRYHTACAPGDNTWSLHARELDLDRASGWGKARHAHLRIADVPILYTPYLSFPIDNRRKSGFLIPIFATSNRNGVDIALPYYLNLAPNMDATLYPRFMTKRGAMLGGEFRYLTRRDSGTVTGEIIPSDSSYDNKMRGTLHVEQNGRFWQRWSTYIDYNWVSDKDYLEDLGSSLQDTSTRRLLQRGDLTYSGDGWTLLGRMQRYQDIDPDSSQPYARLPQLLLSTRQFSFGPGLQAGMQAEYDYFHHDELVHGQRFTFSPRVSWPLRRAYGHLIPSIGVHASQYQLDNQTEGLVNNPSHIVPTFDLDGALVLERPMSWLGNRAMQTLEPRLFYLYTPYVDQSETPVFDSSELDFSFTNLFRRNRFTGLDRIGDANQLTLGLTSRTLDIDTGEELFRASIGRIAYFADRRVQITGAEQTRSSSPFAAEIAGRLLENWHGRATLEWDPEATSTDAQWARRNLQLEYRHPRNDRLLNLAYRFDQDSYEDADLSFRWPLNKGRVDVVGRWLYSLQYERTMDAFVGVEFGQCCWRLRLLGRHFNNSPDTEGSTSVMVQLELAGLGSIGNAIDSLLTQEIRGYQVY